MNTPEKKLTKLYPIAEKIKYCRDFYNSEVYNKNYLIQRAKETDTAYKLRAETTPFTNNPRASPIRYIKPPPKRSIYVV